MIIDQLSIFLNNTVSRTAVVFFELGDTPGALSECVQKVSDAGISIEYMYAFYTGSGASVVVRTEEIERCDALILP